MATNISPFPTLAEILHPHHETTVPGHLSVSPFAFHNRLGAARVCMPTIVSFPKSHAYRPKANGKPGEEQLWNKLLRRWEEPYLAEKVQMLGYRVGETASGLATPTQRVVRLGQAMDGNTMRWMGAFMLTAVFWSSLLDT